MKIPWKLGDFCVKGSKWHVCGIVFLGAVKRLRLCVTYALMRSGVHEAVSCSHVYLSSHFEHFLF